MIHCESMKEKPIPIATPMYKVKLERSINACKLTKHNRNLIRHNRSTVKHNDICSEKHGKKLL